MVVCLLGWVFDKMVLLGCAWCMFCKALVCSLVGGTICEVECLGFQVKYYRIRGTEISVRKVDIYSKSGSIYVIVV